MTPEQWSELLGEIRQIRQLLQRLLGTEAGLGGPQAEGELELPGVSGPDSFREVEQAFAAYGKDYAVTERRARWLRRFMKRTGVPARDLAALVHGCVASWGGIDVEREGFNARQALKFETPFRDDRVDSYLECAHDRATMGGKGAAKARIDSILKGKT